MLKGHLYHTLRKENKVLQLNGRKLTDAGMRDFILENDFSYEELDEINEMNVGDTIKYGGGAAPVSELKRIR